MLFMREYFLVPQGLVCIIRPPANKIRIGTAWAVRDSLAAHFVALEPMERPVTYGKGTQT